LKSTLTLFIVLGMNKDIQAELLALKRRDDDTRTLLVASGLLYQGYNKQMEAVHLQNADRLETIINHFGWPGVSLVGEEGAEAAFTIANHAISKPAFQRKCLALISSAVQIGDVPARHEAHLVDRIRFNERQPQIYGSIFDWDEHGEMSPWRIEKPETVDARRADIGLPPLAAQRQKIREMTSREEAVPPASYAARQKEIKDWCRTVGWL
jgi:hypothetical protein